MTCNLPMWQLHRWSKMKKKSPIQGSVGAASGWRGAGVAVLVYLPQLIIPLAYVTSPHYYVLVSWVQYDTESPLLAMNSISAANSFACPSYAHLTAFFFFGANLKIKDTKKWSLGGF